MAEKEQDTYKDIVFGYHSARPFRVGLLRIDDMDYSDFSIALYKDGSLVHKTYLFSRTAKAVTKYKISTNTVKAIKTVIEKHQEDIDSFDEDLHIMIYDVNCSSFIFNGKKLITWELGFAEEVTKNTKEESEEEKREREKREYPNIYKYKQYMEKYGTKVEAEIEAERKAKIKAEQEAKIKAEQAEQEAQKEKLIIKQERKILSILDTIVQLLKQDGVKLKWEQVNFDEATLDMEE